MPFLVEQTRLAANEKNLINDTAEYTTTSGSWVTLKDYGNITIAADGIIFWQFQARVDNLSYPGYWRLKIGSFYVHGVKTQSSNYVNFGGLAWLAAGTYDVLLEACSGNGGSQIRGTNMQVGYTQFLDEVGSALATYSSGIALTVANRTLSYGSLVNAVYAVNAFAYTASGVANFENIGDNLTNGVSISIDGARVNWSERYQDTDGSGFQNGFARCYLPYAVGSSHTVTLSKRNSNTAVHISVVACPWILPIAIHRPASLNFSQGSTMYAVLEPLFLDVSKFLGAGYVHGVSFGATVDYYNSTSGTGILSWSYRYDVVNQNVGLAVNNTALGGCVSAVGVDAI
jgi:hypothetical protein